MWNFVCKWIFHSEIQASLQLDPLIPTLQASAARAVFSASFQVFFSTLTFQGFIYSAEWKVTVCLSEGIPVWFQNMCICMCGGKHRATDRALWWVHSLRGSAGAWMLEIWGDLHWVETVRFRLMYAYFIMFIIYRYLEIDICIHRFLYRAIFHVFLSILFTYIWNFQSF